MARKSASVLCKEEDKNLDKAARAQSGWEKAILDARKLIGEAERQIESLKRAIRAFERSRDAGDPWPGTASEAGKATKRDGASRGTG